MTTATAKKVAAPRTKKVVELHPCFCSTFRVELKDAADVPAKYRPLVQKDTLDGQRYDTLETGCSDLTAKTFAPGHDARVKGLLQYAHRNNLEVGYEDGGMLRTTSAAKLADQLFPGFAHLVTKAAPEAPVRTPRARRAKTVYAKVGRWTYSGTVNAAGQFVYVNKDDETVTVDRFAIVAGKDNAQPDAK